MTFINPITDKRTIDFLKWRYEFICNELDEYKIDKKSKSRRPCRYNELKYKAEELRFLISRCNEGDCDDG